MAGEILYHWFQGTAVGEGSKAYSFRWRSCCLWAFLNRQVVGRDTEAECPRGAEGQRGTGSSSRVDVSTPSILGYTGSDSSHMQDGQNAVGRQAALEARSSGLRPSAGC